MNEEPTTPETPDTSQPEVEQVAPDDSANGSEGMAATLSEDSVREELKKVIDPELFVNIVDLGLIYVVDFEPVAAGAAIDHAAGRRRSSHRDGPALVARQNDRRRPRSTWYFLVSPSWRSDATNALH